MIDRLGKAADAEAAPDLRLVQLDGKRTDVEAFAIGLDAHVETGEPVFVVEDGGYADLAFQQQIFQGRKVSRLVRSICLGCPGCLLSQQLVQIECIGIQIEFDIRPLEAGHGHIAVEPGGVDGQIEIAIHLLLLDVDMQFEREIAFHRAARQRRILHIQITGQLGQIEYQLFEVTAEGRGELALHGTCALLGGKVAVDAAALQRLGRTFDIGQYQIGLHAVAAFFLNQAQFDFLAADFILLHNQFGCSQIDRNLGTVKIAGHGQFQAVNQKLHVFRLGINVAAQLDDHFLAPGKIALHIGIQRFGDEMLLLRIGHEVTFDLRGDIEFGLLSRQFEIGLHIERTGERDMPGFQIELAQLDLIFC